MLIVGVDVGAVLLDARIGNSGDSPFVSSTGGAAVLRGAAELGMARGLHFRVALEEQLLVLERGIGHAFGGVQNGFGLTLGVGVRF